MEKSLFGVVFRLSHDCTYHRSGRAGDDAAHSGMLDNGLYGLVFGQSGSGFLRLRTGAPGLDLQHRLFSLLHDLYLLEKM